MSDTAEILARLKANIERVIIGKSDTVHMAMVALLARGHLLIEDVPGVGKSTLAHALAHSLGLSFRRIQFTNDILPTDITGVSIFNQKENRFDFKPGPLFANIVLADEINRATPRTQSALLEAMNEKQVSVDNTTHQLEDPFMVIATQNPIESHGAYPLPESQLDRFMMFVSMGYPAFEDERRLLTTHAQNIRAQDLEPVLSQADVLKLQDQVKNIAIEPVLVEYLLNIVTATRNNASLSLGVSPRGGLIFQEAVKACALAHGRAYCLPDDVKEMAVPVLSHRVIPEARHGGGKRNLSDSAAVISDILESVAIPV